MKKYIYFLLILLAFSCTKDKVEAITLPLGYYELTCNFGNGNDIRKGIIKIEESNSKFLILKNNYNDTLKLDGKNILGEIHLPSSGTYIIDGYWSFNSKKNQYNISGNCKEMKTAMGGSLFYYYYGNFEMIKVE